MHTLVWQSAAYSTDGNRLESTTDALGKVTQYGYNEITNVLEWVQYPEDTEATRTEYTYDNMYRMASAACDTDNGNSLSATYTYTDDYLTKIQTPSTTYNFTYGDFGLRTGVSIGSRPLATYNYTEEAERGEDDDRKYDLDSLDYGNGDSVEYEYDDKGRITKETYEDGDTVTYAYDNNGALAKVTDSATGITTSYYYDLTDRMMKYVESGTGYSHSVGYEYDTLNNLTKQVESINGTDHTTTYTYDEDNRIESVTNGAVSQHYDYDGLGRAYQQTTKHNGTDVLTKSATFQNPEAGKTSAQVVTYTIDAAGYDVTYTYTYDDNGNITSISDGTYTVSYEYDSANQLIRENNQAECYTSTWTYDNAGNILSRTDYIYTTGTLGEPIGPVTYTYGDSQWCDLLTAYGGTAITYDQIGNMLTDYMRTYTWEHGRQLATLCWDSNTWTYTYNADGLRTRRTNGTVTYNYVYNGSQLTQMTKGTDTLYFTYDANGTPLTVTYNGTTYYYVTNLQGDVVAILNSAGAAVATYGYDAWGMPLSTAGTMASTLGTLNPLLYRGYVYDTETELYYLQSRYYDPGMGRFINADVFAATGQGILGNNMFAYCGNNPVLLKDSLGTRHEISAGAGGCFTNPGPTVSLWQIIENIVENEDPEVALAGDGIGWYKGVPVIKTSVMGTAAFSFGAIFMGDDLNDPNLLFHEYGHIIQLREIGVSGYIQYVVLPSVTCFWATEAGVLHESIYYNLPWENIADRYGGAERDYISGAIDIADGYWWFSRGMSKLNSFLS